MQVIIEKVSFFFNFHFHFPRAYHNGYLSVLFISPYPISELTVTWALTVLSIELDNNIEAMLISLRSSSFSSVEMVPNDIFGPNRFSVPQYQKLILSYYKLLSEKKIGYRFNGNKINIRLQHQVAHLTQLDFSCNRILCKQCYDCIKTRPKHPRLSTNHAYLLS